MNEATGTTDKHARAGQIGGLTTALRHQGRHSEWGKLGGRPKRLTLAEIRANEPEKEERAPRSAREMIRALREDDAYGNRLRRSHTTEMGSLPRAGSPKEG